MRRVIVVGGGISGLAAAWSLRGRAEVTVLEGDGRIGGKLRTGTLAGVPVDEGAESLMALRPEAVDLAEAVGLGGALRDPAPGPVTLWSRGALRALPPGHVMGVPPDPSLLEGTGLLSEAGLARLRREETLPAPAPVDGRDVSVAEYLAGRLGREAVDRLVEPLLGGVYAGEVDRLSLRSALGPLAVLAGRGGSLLAALRDRPARPPRAVVRGVAGGTGLLPAAVARASGARILTGTPVTALDRGPGVWRVTTADGVLAADAVVLALPAHAAAPLLAGLAPDASAALGGIRHADTAVVALAFPPGTEAGLPPGNGFLVPSAEGRTIKAATLLSRKWSFPGGGPCVVRASLGRAGTTGLVEQPDGVLVARVLADLRAALGPLPEPLAARVTRWPAGLPQYDTGHAARVDRARAAVAELPSLALCGAAYEGVGVAACVATGLRAAESVTGSGAGPGPGPTESMTGPGAAESVTGPGAGGS
ncbi:protoporphyrinogen oxidase [Streptomyces sp. NPDC056503]|uniref:protoporphyrinogen oxidase n=1 Tax=Streptomyces sp. NPDC056503 TaxID=3345842 RepID=UPI0036990365